MTGNFTPTELPASSATPIYTKVAADKPNPAGTQMWFIVCDEGWRQSIVCDAMYDWAADWLIEVLGRRPFAPGTSS